MELTTRELEFDDDLIEGPTMEPVDLDEFKLDQRIKTTSEDTRIDQYISAARIHVEHLTGRQCITAIYERRLEAFPSISLSLPYVSGVVELAHPPLQSVISIAHDIDGSPSETVLVEGTDYVVHAPTGPYAKRGKVRPITGGSWPSVTTGLASVRIRYKAGYGDHPGDVPELLRKLICYFAADFYKARATIHEGAALSTVPIQIESMLNAFKYSALPTLPPMRTTWV